MPVGKKAPKPLEWTKLEVLEPKSTQVNLKHENNKGNNSNKNMSERRAKTKAKTIEKYNTYERLTNIVGKSHTTSKSHTGEESVFRRCMLISQTEANNIGSRHRNDTRRIKQ